MVPVSPRVSRWAKFRTADQRLWYCNEEDGDDWFFFDEAEEKGWQRYRMPNDRNMLWWENARRSFYFWEPESVTERPVPDEIRGWTRYFDRNDNAWWYNDITGVFFYECEAGAPQDWERYIAPGKNKTLWFNEALGTHFIERAASTAATAPASAAPAPEPAASTEATPPASAAAAPASAAPAPEPAASTEATPPGSAAPEEVPEPKDGAAVKGRPGVSTVLIGTDLFSALAVQATDRGPRRAKPGQPPPRKPPPPLPPILQQARSVDAAAPASAAAAPEPATSPRSWSPS